MHRQLIIILLTTFLFNFLVLHGQSNNCVNYLTGEIYDGESNEPIIGAVIEIKNYKLSQETDTSGAYIFTNLCNDSLFIEVNYQGYKKYSSVIKFKNSFHLDILLHSETCELSSVMIVHKNEKNDTKNIGIISENELDKLKSKSIGEIVKTIPGVDAIQVGPTLFKPTIQGFSGNRIVYIQNGVRLEGQNWGNDHAPEISPINVQSVYVIKGATSLLYGPEAQFGAIVLEPLVPPKNHGIFTKYYSGFQSNSRQFNNAFFTQISSHKFDNWYLNLHLSHKKGGNIKTSTHFLDNTGLEDLNYSSTIGYNKNKLNLKFEWSSIIQKNAIYSGAHIGNLEDLIKNFKDSGYVNSNQFSYKINRSFQTIKHDVAHFQLEKTFSKGSKLYSIINYQNNKRKEYDVHRPKNDISDRANVEYYLNSLQFNNIYQHRLIKKWLGKTGFQYLYQDNLTKTTEINALIPNYIQQNLGLFHVSSFSYTKTKFELGIRVDLRKLQIFENKKTYIYSPKQHYTVVNLSGDIIHQFNKKYKLILNTSFNMRPPAVNELFSNGLHHGESIYIVNSKSAFSFKSENTISNNMSFHIHKNKLTSSISAYYNYSSNFIYLKPTTPIVNIRGAFPTFYYEQGNVSILGSDIQNTMQLNKNIKYELKGSINYAKAINIGDYLLNIPPPKINNTIYFSFGSFNKIKNNILGVTYSYNFKQPFFPKTNYEINYNTVNGNKIFLVNGDFMPAPKSYGLTSVFYENEFKIHKSNCSLIFNINNVFNIKYRNYLNLLRYYSDEQGINLGVNLRITI